MSYDSTKRMASCGRLLFAIPMLLLGFAVFGWGLHYKLSLYQPVAQSASQEPAAKLLSPQERSTPPAQQLAQPDPVLVPIILLAAVLLPEKAVTWISWRTRLAQRHSVREPGRAQALFRRPPPPVILHS